MTPPVVLTVAGSDSGGGAGVHADLRTFAALGVHGTSALAALTAQNTHEVRAVRPVPAEFVLAQVDAVLDDMDVQAMKSGFLGTAGVVRAVASRTSRVRCVVVDPVLVSSTGSRLLSDEAETAYREELVPAATVITPNRREAGVLLGRSVETVDEMRTAASELATAGPTVVVKGGDAVDEGDEAIDVVAFGARAQPSLDDLPAPRGLRIVRDTHDRWTLHTAMVPTVNDHGTGCSFAAAIVALVARGRPLPEAIVHAKAFVHHAIEGAVDWRLGAGHGPIDHFGWGSHKE